MYLNLFGNFMTFHTKKIKTDDMQTTNPITSVYPNDPTINLLLMYLSSSLSFNRNYSSAICRLCIPVKDLNILNKVVVVVISGVRNENGMPNNFTLILNLI